MGADNSVLEGCEWGEDVSECNLNWSLQHATAKDGRQVTVFHPKKGERKYHDMLERLAQRLKTLRHPGVLRFMGAGRSSDGFYLVTEQAVPLMNVLGHLSPYDICAGLHDILTALTFLHDKVGVCHNNVSIEAIFVASDGNWRLGELQHTCLFASASPEYLEMCRAFRDQASVAPEEKDGKVKVTPGQGHSRDMYSFGICAKILLDHLREQGEIKISDSFEQRAEACLSLDPALRPPALMLKNDSIFQNDFVQILSFVRNVAGQTTEEKIDFFSGLLPRLLALPEEVIGHRLAVPLLSRFVLMDETAVSHVIPHLLSPKHDDPAAKTSRPGVTPLLSQKIFQRCVLPELLCILGVREAHIRLVLLDHFSQYVCLFDKDTLQKRVFPQLLLGLRDTTDTIVAASLHALADLVPLLGGDTVIGGQRTTIFFHGMPKFADRVKTDEKLPANMKEVLQPVISLSTAKPLLKDLAALSSSADEKKKKQVDHEKRRAEARQKREERHLQMIQTQVQPKLQDTGVHWHNSETTTVTSERSKTFELDKLENNNKDVDDLSSKDSEVHLQLSDHEKEGKKDVQDEDPWSDWEDKDGSSVPLSVDEIISQEIEAELACMSGGEYPSGAPGQRSKIQTSPDPYNTYQFLAHPHMWQDTNNSNRAEKKTLLQDGIAKQAGAGDSVHIQWDTEETDIVKSGNSGDSNAQLMAKENVTLGKSMKLPSKTRSTGAATKAVSGRKVVQGDDLGAGYDIKSVELMVTSSEVDYFADMAPTISRPSAPLFFSEAENVGEERKDKPLRSKTTSSLFAVATTNVTESEGGWSDDGDWGMESV